MLIQNNARPGLARSGDRPRASKGAWICPAFRVVLPLLASLIAPGPARAGMLLDMAANSNIFATGDVNLLAVNVDTRVTAAGNGTFRAVNADSVYVQGDLTVTATNARSVMYGGNFTKISGNIGSKVYMPAPLIDFAAVSRDFSSSSRSYTRLSPNGSVDQDLFGNTTLNGDSARLNVFNIDGMMFGANLTINAPTTSTIVVNVSGSLAFMQQVSLNGLPGRPGTFDPSRVIFNFADADLVQLNSIKLSGTILAPHATVAISGGTMFGSILARDVNLQAVTLKQATFRGLPPEIATAILLQADEPPTLAMAALVAIPLALYHRRRSRR